LESLRPKDGGVAMQLVSKIHCRILLLLFSVSVQPVAVFPLNRHCGGLEKSSRANLATLSPGVAWAAESDGIHNKPLQLRGTPDSFVEIPNHPGSFIDTRTSITLLMDIFPTGNRGSILSFRESGGGLQIVQDGVVDGKGVLTVRFARRDLTPTPPLTKAVLKLNAWNFIGASYDYDSGIARLWHDGNDVEAKYIGRKLELATQFSIRIGPLNAPVQRCFQGRVTDLHIFAESLGKVTVRAFGGIVPQGKLVFFSRASLDGLKGQTFLLIL